MTVCLMTHNINDINIQSKMSISIMTVSVITVSIMIINIMTVSILTVSTMTIKINKSSKMTQHRNTKQNASQYSE
jgi:hypothetical protein